MQNRNLFLFVFLAALFSNPSPSQATGYTYLPGEQPSRSSGSSRPVATEKSRARDAVDPELARLVLGHCEQFKKQLKGAIPIKISRETWGNVTTIRMTTVLSGGSTGIVPGPTLVLSEVAPDHSDLGGPSYFCELK